MSYTAKLWTRQSRFGVLPGSKRVGGGYFLSERATGEGKGRPSAHTNLRCSAINRFPDPVTERPVFEKDGELFALFGNEGRRRVIRWCDSKQCRGDDDGTQVPVD